MKQIVITAIILLVSASTNAQQIASDDFTFENGILITSADVITCPYRLIQPISIDITEDYNQDTRERIFSKFRDKATVLGADAVVLVTKGSQHMTMWAWHRRNYTGRAIRYVDKNCAPVQ